MTENVKVTVILPVYGVAEYIEACTESLLSQTLEDMQFIFVDDHGPDESIAIAQRAISGHKREGQFLFLRPERNLGAGMARNYALPYAKGEYVAFVDSDDTIAPEMFQLLYDEAHRTDSDLCCCQLQKCYPDGSRGEILKNPHIDGTLLDHERRAYVLTRYVSLFASMVFRRSMIEQYDICFPEDRAADDSYFVGCAWMVARSVSYVNQPLYNYMIRSGSVTTTKDSDKWRKRMTVFAKLMDFAKRTGVYDEFKGEIDFMYIKKGYLSSVMNYVINSSAPRMETIGEIVRQAEQVVPEMTDNSYLRRDKAMRATDWLVRHTPRMAVVALRAYAKHTKLNS